MSDLGLLAAPLLLLVVLCISAFVGCDYLVSQGLEDVQPDAVLLRLRFPAARPIGKVTFHIDLFGGGDIYHESPTRGLFVTLVAGSTTVDSNLPVWRDIGTRYGRDRTPEFSNVTVLQQTAAGTGEFSVLIKQATVFWNAATTWAVSCEASERADGTGAQFPYYDSTRVVQQIVHQRIADPLPVVAFPFILTTAATKVVPDVSLVERPSAILSLKYAGDVQREIVRVSFRIQVDGGAAMGGLEGTLTLRTGQKLEDGTGFSQPNISVDETTHDTNTDSGEWQATVKFPPLGSWRVFCSAYRFDQQTKMETILFAEGGTVDRQVEGIDPQTPVKFNFRVNRPTGTIEPA